MEKYQTLVPRFWALILDSVLLLPLAIVDDLIKDAGFSQESKWTLYLTVSLAQTIYFIAMHGAFGQTVGKMLMKVKVLDSASETPISFWQAILRDLPQVFFTVGWFVFLFPLSPNDVDADSPGYWKNPFIILIFVWGVADIIAALTSSKRRALHDHIAGTIVVRTNQNSETR